MATASALGGVLLLAVLAAGCSSQPHRPPTAADGPVLPHRVPSPRLETLPPPRPPVAVVLSAETDHYRRVADALGEGDWRRYVLNGSNGDQVLAAVTGAGHAEAIAIGQQALTLLTATDLEVVYCQVFDPSARGGGRRGVALLPDFGAQLDAWRARQPTLRRIGLITGSEHRAVAGRLLSAAEARAVALSHAVVRTDKEFLYVFRRMVPDIDGFLLYPDTSVLSPGVIRELLAYARKHGVRVLTYNRAVYEAGAALLVSADPREVALQVMAALDAEADALQAPLSRVVVETSFLPEDGG